MIQMMVAGWVHFKNTEMEKEKVLTEDDFYLKYHCEYNRVLQAKLAAEEDNGRTTIADMGSYGGCMYETYGEEYKRVEEMLVGNHKRIWTIITCGEWEGICAGWHYINRTGYLITEEEWETGDEVYVTWDTSELREQWESLPLEALHELIGMEICDMGDDGEDVRDDNFYIWEEMDELRRDEILQKYKEQIDGKKEQEEEPPHHCGLDTTES